MKKEIDRKTITDSLSNALSQFVSLYSTKEPSKTEEMQQNIREILDMLATESKNFDSERVKGYIDNYLRTHKRILYSEISAYFYNKHGKQDTIITNINTLLDYCLDKDETLEIESTKVVLKIWDHINLANSQFTNLKISNEEINRRIERQSAPTSRALIKMQQDLENSKKDLENSKKELYSQLISIVSIFVAISFVMFGGMSLMNNLFDYSELKRIPLFEMICAGSLIGIVMILLMYAFIVFILRITGKLEHTLEEKEEIKKISDYITELHNDQENEELRIELTKYLKDKKYIKLPYRRLVVILCAILLIVMGISGGACIWQSVAYPQQQIENDETVQKIIIQPDQESNSNQENDLKVNNNSSEANK